MLKKAKQLDAYELRDLFLDTLNFKLYKCGVSQKELPYVEHWTDPPNGYISQCLKAKTTIYFKKYNKLLVDSGDTMIIPPKTQHRCETLKTPSQTEAVFRWSHFSFFVVHSIDVFNFFKLPHLLKDEESERLGALIEAITVISEDMSIPPIAASIRIKKIAFELLEFMLETVPLNENYIDKQTDMLSIKPTLQYIENNFANKITIDCLAKTVNMSQTRFHVAFKKIMGISPIKYVIQERLRQSQRLLLMKDLTISEIAMRCGYEDQFFFSKLFKQHIGIPPSEYRQQSTPFNQ